MKENAIISLADSNYFELLNELIDSIRQFNQGQNISICILDAGLTEEQLIILNNKVDQLKVKGREWLKSQVSRAFLPKYFPDYKKYLWIDCDAWVQDWSAIELFLKACENGKLGITQTMTPGYRIMSKVNWVFGKLATIKSQNFKHALKSKIGLDKARKLAFAPHINIGVFSLDKNSICWDMWQKNLRITLKNGQIFGSEQLAINMSVYIDEVETEFLPHNCNWIVSNLMPKYNEENEFFVEPFLPNQKIGIIHLASGIWLDNKDMRIDKSVKVPIKTLKEKSISKSLRYGN